MSEMMANCISANHSLALSGFNLHCFVVKPSSIIMTMYIMSNALFLAPLYIFILRHGLQDWQQKRSSSSTAALSHSDCFTYHLVTMELIGVLGLFLMFIGIYQEHDPLLTFGFVLVTFTWYAQTWMHVLTCVERFLAVVHPITYMKLRSKRAIRLRSLALGCIWMLCFLGIGFLAFSHVLLIFDYSLLTFCLMVTVFCSLSVLQALNRPGPGEQVEGRERIDQSKQKALYTILSILAVLILRFIGSLLWTIIFTSQISNECLIMACTAWLDVPSSLVLPLLFLNKTGKLSCFKK